MASAFTALVLGLINILNWLFSVGGILAQLIGVTAVTFLAKRAAAISLIAVSMGAIVSLLVGSFAAAYILINSISTVIGTLPSWMLVYMEFICPPHINLFLSVGIAANALISGMRILYVQIKMIQSTIASS